MPQSMNYPSMLRARQAFERPQVHDIPDAVSSTIEKLDLSHIHAGQRVALTAGSRGIANIAAILQAVVKQLKHRGARPFIVPAMGSHGGGTAEGQRKILEGYGITEATVEAPIFASMDVIDLGTAPEGYPVYLDRIASEADHIAVIARIKPHTAFYGPIESGLMKMMLIGLGKHTGALAYHRLLMETPYEKVVRAVGRHMLSHAPIAFGLGIVENAYDETAILEAIPPDRFIEREEHLLSIARKNLATLPYSTADLLIIDEIGKDVSGSGMDTNVVGRRRPMPFQAMPPTQPEMRYIFVRDLTSETHGNAAGVGLANFTTQRLVDRMDYHATVVNCMTAGYTEGAMIPVHFKTDREVIDAALKVLGSREPQEARILRIRNTLSLEEIELSEPCLESQPENDLQLLTSAASLAFGEDGNCLPFGQMA